ncbi:unnamed protein product [Cladocopium goreaui]|uniref:RxLR effector protein n=1 Tax=Cladocopium goreaui TaxID=2562237 RepID=A0A9P1DIK0_9DINO|nr:unnamed protein product [Cladocopium goreaui]
MVRPPGKAARCWGLLLVAVLCNLQAFVGVTKSPSRPRVAAAAERTVAEDKEISDKLDEVLRKKLKNEDGTEKSGLSESARKAVDKVAGVKRRQLKAPKKKSRSIVKKSLDEVLKSASEDDDKGNYLPAKRDVYKEVGITRTEVERYWKRRDESSKNFVDKFVGAMALYR